MSTVVVDGSSLNYGPANEITVAKPSVNRSRLCSSCQCPIPANRMKANPKATSCVPCLEAAGDVAPLRRLDEGDDQTMYYAGDPRMERETHRVHQNIPGAAVLSDQTEAPLLVRTHRMRSHEQLSNEIVDSIAYDKENNHDNRP